LPPSSDAVRDEPPNPSQGGRRDPPSSVPEPVPPLAKDETASNGAPAAAFPIDKGAQVAANNKENEEHEDKLAEDGCCATVIDECRYNEFLNPCFQAVSEIFGYGGHWDAVNEMQKGVPLPAGLGDNKWMDGYDRLKRRELNKYLPGAVLQVSVRQAD
jgi:hypothetical protein